MGKIRQCQRGFAFQSVKLQLLDFTAQLCYLEEGLSGSRMAMGSTHHRRVPPELESETYILV